MRGGAWHLRAKRSGRVIGPHSRKTQWRKRFDLVGADFMSARITPRAGMNPAPTGEKRRMLTVFHEFAGASTQREA